MNMKGSMQKPSTKAAVQKTSAKPTSPVKKTPVVSATELREPEKVTDTEGWLTRNETSDVLRCSLQTLKNYEARDMLHPRHALRRDRTGNERTMLVYNPKELAELPAKKPGGPQDAVREVGERAARAFELFRDSWTLDAIVVELREDPDKIEQLHERWLDQSKARYVITVEAKRALEQLVGTFTSVTELVELVAQKLTSP